MSFATWYYPFFLLVIAALFWLAPRRARAPLILGASFVFYAYWDVRFIAMLIAAGVVDWTCSNAIDGGRPSRRTVFLVSTLPLAWLLAAAPFQPVPVSAIVAAAIGAPAYAIAFNFVETRKQLLWLAIASSLVLLGFFKYASWFADNLRIALESVGMQAGWSTLYILLPIGISFHIFQSIAYVVDVYHGKLRAEPSFLRIMNMLCFFPQLVAGPIERAAHMLPQLAFDRALDWKNVAWGCHLILVGYFLKAYLADSCGVVADYYFNALPEKGGAFGASWTLAGLVAFSLQIYGDFAGYSLIARGSAQFFGVTLFRNFALPYLALTPSDFWRRWHISLSSWFRDYVYIPLGGNRSKSAQLVARNLMLTMLLAGLWHGASWRFAVWGALHGGALIAWRAARLPEADSQKSLLVKIACWALTLAVVIAAWAVFRANSLADVHTMLVSLGHWQSSGVPDPAGSWKWIAFHAVPWIVLLCLVGRDREEADIARLPLPVLAFLYWLMVTLVLSAGNQRPEFIYFQF
ncbi:MAG: MBOAT family O-acyltransferase [Betaproteobacteria bacterium]